MDAFLAAYDMADHHRKDMSLHDSGGVTARRYATASGVDVSLTFYSKEMMAFEDEVDLHAHVDVLRQLAHHGNIANLHEFYSDCYDYIAPEVLDNIDGGDGGGCPYGVEVDIWSVGVLVFVLLGGYLPFHGPTQVELFQAIKTGHVQFDEPYWQHISNDAKDFICSMLVTNPRRRYAAPEVVSSQLCVHDSGDDKRHYDKPADVWSVGVVAFVLLCGYLPFHGRSAFHSFRRIKRGKVEFESPYWDHISSDAKAFISSALMVQTSVQVSSTKSNEPCDVVQKKCDTAGTVQSA
ncbi:hypothetical protein DYB36_006540 [Aphanomyces astaci]|uniref:Protein kinase domain-containing protein n=1 Tax=Aphanomyces astaci TaxID=112090 RepID=A0A396ZSN1_APHAT|nr:hypothetical protein DYB36_006540 [Aphanomyces astaci]